LSSTKESDPGRIVPSGRNLTVVVVEGWGVWGEGVEKSGCCG
jgi:hypothetical protein